MRGTRQATDNFPYLPQVARGALVTFCGLAFSTALNYGYTVYLARRLGSHDFGLFCLGAVVFNLVFLAAVLGLNKGVLRYVSLYQGLDDWPATKGALLSALSLALPSGLLLGAALYLASGLIGEGLFGQVGLAGVLRILALAVPFCVLSEILVGASLAFKDTAGRVYVKNVIEPVGKFALTAALLAAGLSLRGALLANLGAYVLGALMASYYVVRLLPAERWRAAEAQYRRRELLAFSLPLLLTNFLEMGAFRVDSLLLGYYWSADHVGVYNAAAQTTNLIVIVLTSVNTIFSPLSSELLGRGEVGELRELTATVTRWIVTASLPLFLVLVLFPRQVMGLFGPRYLTGATCLAILACGQLVNAATGPVNVLLVMMGKTRVVLWNAVAWLTVAAALNYALIPSYGMAGAAVGTAIAFASLHTLRLLEVRRFLGRFPYGRSFAKPALAAAGAGGLILALRALEAPAALAHGPAAIALLVAGYAAFLCSMRLEGADRDLLARLKTRLWPAQAGT